MLGLPGVERSTSAVQCNSAGRRTRQQAPTEAGARSSSLCSRLADARRRHRCPVRLWPRACVPDKFGCPAVAPRVPCRLETAKAVAVAPCPCLVADWLPFSEGIRESQERGPFSGETSRRCWDRGGTDSATPRSRSPILQEGRSVSDHLRVNLRSTFDESEPANGRDRAPTEAGARHTLARGWDNYSTRVSCSTEIASTGVWSTSRSLAAILAV